MEKRRRTIDKRKLTPKQRRLVDGLIKNAVSKNPKPSRRVMLDAGYKFGSTHDPSKYIQTPVVQDALAEAGFDSNLAKKRVGNVLKNTKSEDMVLRSAKLIFDVNGDLAPQKVEAINITASVDVEAMKEAARAYAEIVKKRLQNHGTPS